MKFTIRGEEFTGDIDDVTLGESALLEDIMGEPFMEVQKNPDRYGVRLTMGLIHIGLRRKHPDWAQERITAEVDGIRWNEIEMVNEVDESGEGDAGPPDVSNLEASGTPDSKTVISASIPG